MNLGNAGCSVTTPDKAASSTRKDESLDQHHDDISHVHFQDGGVISAFSQGDQPWAGVLGDDSPRASFVSTRRKRKHTMTAPSPRACSPPLPRACSPQLSPPRNRDGVPSTSCIYLLRVVAEQQQPSHQQETQIADLRAEMASVTAAALVRIAAVTKAADESAVAASMKNARAEASLMAAMTDMATRHAEQIAEATHGNFCAVCWARAKTNVLVPCGHLILCSDCASRVKTECPMCCNPFTQVITVFR